jgi:hypothetical protein
MAESRLDNQHPIGDIGGLSKFAAMALAMAVSPPIG